MRRKQKPQKYSGAVIHLKDMAASPDMIERGRGALARNARSLLQLFLLALAVTLAVVFITASPEGRSTVGWVLVAIPAIFCLQFLLLAIRTIVGAKGFTSVVTRFAISKEGLHSQVLVNDRPSGGGVLAWSSLLKVEETSEGVRLSGAKGSFAVVKNEVFRSDQERKMLLQLANSRGSDVPKDLTY